MLGSNVRLFWIGETCLAGALVVKLDIMFTRSSCEVHTSYFCRFTTAALEVQDSAEAQRAQAILRCCGGRRFTASTVNLLHGVDKNNILALCPCSLTKHKLAQLQSWGDFTMGRSLKVNAIAYCWLLTSLCPKLCLWFVHELSELKLCS